MLTAFIIWIAFSRIIRLFAIWYAQWNVNTERVARLREKISLPEPGPNSPFPVHEFTNFKSVEWIRKICKENDLKTAQILYTLIPFTWHPEMCETSQYYWTENHAMQYAQAQCILGQILGKNITGIEQDLISLLKFKERCGMAEFLSPTYIPHTFRALLNIYDFTENEELKSVTKRVLDMICRQFAMLGSSTDTFISPAGRCYYTRKGPPTTKPVELANFAQGREFKDEFLKKTSYISPKEICDEVTETLKISPSSKELEQYLEKIDDLESRTTVQWSHGQYWSGAGKDFVTMYDRYNLWAHKSWWFLSLVPFPTAIRYIFNSSFLNGFPLTDAKIQIFRRKHLCVASLVNFQPGKMQMQQCPWTVNCDGASLFLKNKGWHFFPEIDQDEGRLRATYPWYNRTLTPYWEPKEFEAHGEHAGWTWGVNQQTGVAWRIEGRTIDVITKTDVADYEFIEFLTSYESN